MGVTSIEWTNATWNPVVGCTKTGSPGCVNCYAIDVAHRGLQEAHRGLTVRRPGERADWSGVVRCLPDRIRQPLEWRAPRRVFVNSMSDLFHPDVLNETYSPAGRGTIPFLVGVFTTMVLAEQHTFQILTKRPQLMASVLGDPMFRTEVNAELLADHHSVMKGGFESDWPANLWLGTSIETDRYTFRADHLRATPAAVRFLSLEPLLGPLPSLDLTDIDQVIVGAESGPGARPMDEGWVRDLRDQAVAAGVAFFYKQAATAAGHKVSLPELDGRQWAQFPDQGA